MFTSKQSPNQSMLTIATPITTHRSNVGLASIYSQLARRIKENYIYTLFLG